MRRGDDDHVRLRDDLLQRHEGRILDERIGAQDGGALERRQLAKLVAKRGPRVVGLTFERHAEDAHGPPRQRLARVQRIHYVVGQPLVDLHRRLAHWKVIWGESRELHRVLQQARPGGEPGAGEVGSARVVASNCVEHVVVIEARAVDDLKELVGNGELHVAPRVGQQLRELGLQRCRPHDSHAQRLEEAARLLETAVRRRADQLRQAADLLQRVPLRNSLRTEDHLHVEPRRPQPPLHGLRRAGEDCRPQDDKAAVAKVRHQVVQDAVEHTNRWVHELVDWRADDKDHRVGSGQQAGIRRQLEAAAGQDLLEEGLRPVLQERHTARADLGDLGGVDIVDPDPVAAVRQRERKRQADVAAAADDDDVQGVHGRQIMMAPPVASSLR